MHRPRSRLWLAAGLLALSPASLAQDAAPSVLDRFKESIARREKALDHATVSYFQLTTFGENRAKFHAETVDVHLMWPKERWVRRESTQGFRRENEAPAFDPEATHEANAARMRIEVSPGVVVFDGVRTLQVCQSSRPGKVDGGIKDGLDTFTRRGVLECGLMADQHWLSEAIRTWTLRKEIRAPAPSDKVLLLFTRGEGHERAWLRRVVVSPTWDWLPEEHTVTEVAAKDLASVLAAVTHVDGALLPQESFRISDRVLEARLAGGVILPSHVRCSSSFGGTGPTEGWLAFEFHAPGKLFESDFSSSACPPEFRAAQVVMRDASTNEMSEFINGQHVPAGAPGSRFPTPRTRWLTMPVVVAFAVVVVVAGVVVARTGRRKPLGIGAANRRDRA